MVFSKLGVLCESYPDIYGEREYHIYVVTEWVGQGPVALGEEHSEIRWFSVNEALQLDLAHPRYAELFEAIRQ
jgi:8-oxo-dGTP diphosphatase